MERHFQLKSDVHFTFETKLLNYLIATTSFVSSYVPCEEPLKGDESQQFVHIEVDQY